MTPSSVGGTGLVEGSGEVRYRINASFGAVGFVDAGYVTENGEPRRRHDLQTGAGLGVRYYTGIGVLRVDLATPLSPRPDDSRVALLHRHRAGVLKRLVAASSACSCSSPSPRSPRTGRGRSDNGFLINLLENQLSSPGRQIRLSGVTGALSSRARIATDHHLRRQGRLARDRQRRARLEPARAPARAGDVNRLERRARRLAAPAGGAAAPARKLPHAEAQPFSLPELPVSIQMRELAFPHVSFDESVFGQAAELSARRLARPRQRRPRHRSSTSTASTGRAARSRSRPASPTPPASSTSTSACRSRRAASSRPSSGSRARRRSTYRPGLRPPRRRRRRRRPRRRPGAHRRGRCRARVRRHRARLRRRLQRRAVAARPAPYRDFFAGDSTVRVRASRRRRGACASPSSPSRAPCSTSTAASRPGSDGFLRDLALTGTLGGPTRGPAGGAAGPGRPHDAPVGGAQRRLRRGQRWNGFVVLDRLSAADIEMEDVIDPSRLEAEIYDLIRRIAASPRAAVLSSVHHRGGELSSISD